MLKFDKGRSNKIGISLRKKHSFFSPDLLKAIGAVFLVHILFFTLFSIKKNIPETELLDLTQVDLAFEHKQFLVNKEVDLSQPLLPFNLNLSSPPRFSPPDLNSLLPRLKEEVNLDSNSALISNRHAHVLGYFPQELDLPMLDSPILQFEEAIISVRSDKLGKIYWMEWVKKTSRPPLNAELEKWVKNLKLLPEGAFSPQLIEIRLHP